MTYFKYKQCDVCGHRDQIEPILIGRPFCRWAEMKVESETGFMVTRHFCSNECVREYVRKVDKDA